MEPREEELVRSLSTELPELREAYETHTALKKRVDELRTRAVLTTEEQREQKELQKKKLAEKDRIMRILAEHRRTDDASAHA